VAIFLNYTDFQVFFRFPMLNLIRSHNNCQEVIKHPWLITLPYVWSIIFMLFQFQVKKSLTKTIKCPPHRIIASLGDQTQYQRPSPPNIVRLSDDKQVILVEWPKHSWLWYCTSASTLWARPQALLRGWLLDQVWTPNCHPLSNWVLPKIYKRLYFKIGIMRSPLKSHRFSDPRNRVSMNTLFK
jgi:hypothetical protein